MTALAPRLRPLDERVLGALTAWLGQRADRVTQLVHGVPAWRCDTCGHQESVGHHPPRDPIAWEANRPRRCLHVHSTAAWCDTGRMLPVLVVTKGQVAEVREVLRGLERVGLAYQAGGWWRRV